MKETRAIILGVLVVVLIALVWSFVRLPISHSTKVRSFHVEIHDSTDNNNISLHIPGFLAGEVLRIAARSMNDHDFQFSRSDYNGVSITPHDILAAANASQPGHPVTVATRPGEDHGTVQVERDGARVKIHVVNNDDTGTADITAPYSLLEALDQGRRVTARDLVAKIDELAPGDLIDIRGQDGGEVRISAETR